jgi:hypothetical protein
VATLQTYLNETQRLLHDANAKVWQIPTLIAAINQARRRSVGDSSCNRQIQSVTLSAGREVYAYGSVVSVTITNGGTGYTVAPTVTFSAPPAGGTAATGTAVIDLGSVTKINIVNPGSGYLTAPTVTLTGGNFTSWINNASVVLPWVNNLSNIVAWVSNNITATAVASILNPNTLDVMNITVSWGSQEYILGRRAFTEFQAGIRSWTGFKQRPLLCASYGQNQWFIGPIPDQDYESQWDSIITPNDLVNLTDRCVVGYPFNECVAYYAAHICKFQEQSYAEAEIFLQQYTRKMMYSRRSVMLRQLPSTYYAG